MSNSELTSITLFGYNTDNYKIEKQCFNIVSFADYDLTPVLGQFKFINQIRFHSVQSSDIESVWQFFIANRHYFITSNHFPGLIFDQSIHSNPAATYFDRKLDDHNIIVESSTPIQASSHYEFDLDSITQLPGCTYSNNRHSTNCRCGRLDMLTFLATVEAK